MATTEKETPAKKAAAPSVSQINAEYVTQVIIGTYYTCGPALYVEIMQSVLYIDPVSLFREHEFHFHKITSYCILCHPTTCTKY